jgi:hypothetical protein
MPLDDLLNLESLNTVLKSILLNDDYSINMQSLSVDMFYVKKCIAKVFLGLELLVFLNEMPINDKYIINLVTNLDRKQPRRTH